MRNHQFHIIFAGDAEHEHEHEQDADAGDDHDEFEFDEPIPEEDEEDEQLFDALPPKVPMEPPILSINLGSPASLSFNIP